MSSNNHAEQVEDTLENHELAVKRAMESLGTLEERLHEVASDASTEERAQFEPIGRALEDHVERLEGLVRTLNDHKGAVRGNEDSRSDAFSAAIERSRRRARQESPPDSGDSGVDRNR